MSDDVILADIRHMDQQIEAIIGRTVFGHIAKPTPTSTRITFGDGHVALSMAEAQAYMRTLLNTAINDPTKLPWPLCEDLPISQAPA